MDELVQRSDRDGIATLRLNRPSKHNALTPAMFDELSSHIWNIHSDESVGCVVLAGNGPSFCAGNDLGGVAQRTSEPTQSAHPQADVIDALEALPQITIGAIHGYCLTGGLELALGCDVLVASASAVIGDTHGQWGLAPVWGMTVRLPERVGQAQAKLMMATSLRMTGVIAGEMGLVDVVVSDSDLESRVAELAAEIVANSWETNRICKRLIADQQSETRRAALIRERSEPYGQPKDRAERLARFTPQSSKGD